MVPAAPCWLLMEISNWPGMHGMAGVGVGTGVGVAAMVAMGVGVACVVTAAVSLGDGVDGAAAGDCADRGQQREGTADPLHSAGGYPLQAGSRARRR